MANRFTNGRPKSTAQTQTAIHWRLNEKIDTNMADVQKQRNSELINGGLTLTFVSEDPVAMKLPHG